MYDRKFDDENFSNMSMDMDRYDHAHSPVIHVYESSVMLGIQSVHKARTINLTYGEDFGLPAVSNFLQKNRSHYNMWCGY